ncbi:arginine utilization regulatory protein RocR [Lysinibacillus alkalisoli]|uniref:Arginine utilization regulatory protein RocR n=1 Tax=Lysinibacillus alkalisoli TaxID=1911548 RepID=A0A917G2M0_9BACI|nr:PAS domain S-box protein [Lysinibacillus alkalisoli]GGG18848.1 arginine utilization regulatory protein RocR [Lysinibacillus alkalisoli]
MNTKTLLAIYEFIAEQSASGICAIDKRGNLILYNKRMRELVGISDEEFEKRKALEIIDADVERSALLRVLETKEPLLNMKKTFWNKRGEEVTTISHVHPLIVENELVGAVEFVRDITQLEFMMYQPLRRYGAPLKFEIITAVSKAMQKVINTAKVAAMGRLPVMLIGESGTGKDMIAEGIHHVLAEPNELFVTLICRRDEKTVLAQLEKYIVNQRNITFFAERVEYLSMEAQEQIAKLLEEHEERKHYFIASVGQDPVDLIRHGKLSQTLYHLFSNISIQVPALRERKEDILPFIYDYFRRHREQYGSQIKALSPDVEELLLAYDWPGNLKELEVMLDEVSTVIAREEVLEMYMLPAHLKWRAQQKMPEEKTDLFVVMDKQDLRPLDTYMHEVEDYYIARALEFHNGNISKTAEALGIRRQSLQYRIKKFEEKKSVKTIEKA